MSLPPKTTPPTVACAPGDPGHRARSVPTGPANDAAFERAAAIFRAAGDVPRLRLLDRLAEGEWCVSELAEDLDEGLSAISQRLRLLRADGLVARRRDGKHVYYRLADRHVAELIRNGLDHAREEADVASDDDG